MPWFRPRDRLDQTFEVGIILKGLDGVLEVIAGLTYREYRKQLALARR